jgi:hypothetical protein
MLEMRLERLRRAVVLLAKPALGRWALANGTRACPGTPSGGKMPIGAVSPSKGLS